MTVDWETLFALIDPSLLVVVAACWALGYVLKQTPRVPDWTIVYIVTVAAVAVVVALQGFTVQSVIQGILCGAFAVYGHQVVKQTKERE
jgi:4-hydroxybenzoate polyprenyltransferase